MQDNLMNTLIERNLLTDNTIVTSEVSSIAWNGVPLVSLKEIHWNKVIKCDNILAIESMAPERFAKSYNIKPDGSSSTQKKRGRKSKQIT